jgi:hypothetical protein
LLNPVTEAALAASSQVISEPDQLLDKMPVQKDRTVDL